MQPLGDMLRGALGLHQQGKLAEAEQLYAKVLQADARQFDALHLLGLLKHQRGDSTQALPLFEAALKANPKSFEALMNYGGVLSVINRHAEALAAYDRALTLKPDRADVHYSRGNALMGLGRHADALACYDRALALKPDDPATLYNRANALSALNRPADAVAAYDKVLALAPKHADALVNRGKALRSLNRFEEALSSLDQALKLRPDDALAQVNRGLALAALDRLADAIQAYDHALQLKPDDTGALINRGVAYFRLNRHQEALASYDRALARAPGDADAHWNASLARLVLGDFAKGWKDYEWRWQSADFPAKPRDFPYPRWNGEYVKGNLLAWGEQGVGDEILYASMVPDLTAHSDTVTLEADPRLVDLFARSFPGVRVVARGKEIPQNVAAQSALASLGQYLRPSPEAFPWQPEGYLRADPARRAALRKRLSPHGEKVVGLAWISKNPAIGKFKTARLTDFAPLLRSPGCRFVDLQYGDTAAERAALKQETGLSVERLDDIDNTNDLDALAALIAACDAVVTVSNVTAHFAGALGKPTWVFVPYLQGRIWYWFKDQNDSPWYPRVRIRRQQNGQSWAELIAGATDEISAFLGAAS